MMRINDWILTLLLFLLSFLELRFEKGFFCKLFFLDSFNLGHKCANHNLQIPVSNFEFVQFDLLIAELLAFLFKIVGLVLKQITHLAHFIAIKSLKLG